MSLLLKFGAGSAMDRKSIHGDTALGKARLWERPEIVAVLEAEKAKRQAEEDEANRQRAQTHYEL